MKDKKLNVVFVTYGMKFGGAEKVIATVANSLVQRKNKCNIITLINDECVYDLEEGIEVLPMLKKKGKPEGLGKLKAYRNLRKMVQNLNPDVVVCMPEEISAKAIPALKGLACKIVVSERNNPYVMPENKLNRALRWLYYPKVDGIIFQTQGAAEFFSKKVQKKGTIILNPLDSSRIPKREHVNKENRRKVIVSVGRLAPQKNHKLLILAFKEFYKIYPDYKLKIYGNGPMKDELKEFARANVYCDNYEFIDATNDVLDIIYDSEMFVLSSDYEGLPNALIEAMACGLACISTDCPSGGPVSLIENGVNGLLVKVGSVNEMMRAMCKIADGGEEIEKMRSNAVKIADLMETDKITREWEDYLRKVCSTQYEE